MTDAVLRAGIRGACALRLRRERRRSPAERRSFVDGLRLAPIAEQVEKANEQHYELPAEFFQLVLGPRLKYSSCYWPDGVETLA
jgi:cyclopropane-fatty-acyl-phospholipid synthase